jgi:hypothetical protein
MIMIVIIGRQVIMFMIMFMIMSVFVVMIIGALVPIEVDRPLHRHRKNLAVRAGIDAKGIERHVDLRVLSEGPCAERPRARADA